jgi:peptidyl-prolyl cis-trans isomerase A (cyclophilin A)
VIGCSAADRSPAKVAVTLPAFTPSSALRTPDTAALRAAAPDSFHIVFVTSEGEVEVAVSRRWGPHGVDRLHFLTRNGFYTGARFYRVQRDRVAQFGLTSDPSINLTWDTLRIPDDPRVLSNTKGMLGFGSTGPNSRTTELYFNLSDNLDFDEQSFTPIGRVVRGMDALLRLFSQYGQGLGPEKIKTDGDAYLRGFPDLDFIVSATISP